MANEGRKLFPIRLFGFSMFWAWLFLVAVSPSPIFGQLYDPAGLPYEISEIVFRLIALALVLALRRDFSSVRGKRVLLATCFVAGPLSAVMPALYASPFGALAAAALAGLADASMFLMWLCFFGYMRLDETLKLIVLSYAGGSLLCLAVSALPPAAMIALAPLFPIASGASFILSERYYQAQRGSELFVRLSPNPTAPPLPPAVRSLTAALALISFAFALLSSAAVLAPESAASGPLMQSGCSLAVAALVLVVCETPLIKGRLYQLYRGIPLLMGLGFCLLLIPAAGLPAIGGCAVVFAFLLFEALSLNDYCNVVKTDDSSLLATMARARIAASAGMLAGWALCQATAAFAGIGSMLLAAIILGIASALVVGTIVFTDTSINGLARIAFGRAMLEKAEETPAREQYVASFAERYGLSKRETEVLDYLLAGRTTQYISEKLFISDSTARSHVHKIYQKTDTHTRMELIDSFEDHQAAPMA